MKPIFEKDSTNVLGYFNQQKWPVHVHISAVNLSVQLPPKAYLVDRQGRKVNDPRLEVCVGPNGLSREYTQEGKLTPILRMGTKESIKSPNSATVGEAKSFKRDSTGRVVPVFSPAAPMPTPPSQSNSAVRGMSIEEARRLHLIKPTRQVVEPQIEDTDGHPVQGAIPDIEDLTPTDVRTPGEARRAMKAQLAPDSGIKPENVDIARQLTETEVQEPTVDLAALSRKIVAAPVIPAAVGAPTSLPQPSLPELPQPNIPDTDTVSVSDITTSDVVEASNVEKEIKKSNKAKRVVKIKTPAKPMEVGEVASVQKDNPTAGSMQKFVCSADGKEFPYRSELERYAKRKYPARLEEIMSHYPKAKCHQLV